MQTGRKIMNLRRDRSISQQDLARFCEITPSALSKIESGQNSPRGGVIFRIAKNLGVTIEYLLDEEIPYPYKGLSYREKSQADPDAVAPLSRMEVSKEERAFLDALRESPEMVRELAHSLPEAKPEVIRLLHFLLYHFEVENPGPDFLSRFEGVISPSPDDEDEAAAPQKSAKRKKTSSMAGKKSAAKTRKKTRSKTR
jgi:transcriptional regulator with XRE-family HTH domain